MSASRLPPLNALRAFEAVARHRSFRKAAEELFVTPAAISHQIKGLEDHLGLPLFVRLNRRIELTEAAHSALPLMQKGFEALVHAVAELRSHGRTPGLTIGATPTFVSRWLMPRLHGFLKDHPGIDVRLVASGRLIHVLREAQADSVAGDTPLRDADIEIHFDDGQHPGRVVDLLFPVEVVPMCHPDLLTRPSPLAKPEDLRHHTLLHGDGRFADRSQSLWARWLNQMDVSGVDARRGLQFDHSTMALEAAADGLGVALATPQLAAEELEEGKVVILFPWALPLDDAYHLVVSESALERPEVAAFRNWLLAEAQLAAKARAVG
jgi:LysR family glycine cleavage system transcriptional activator